MFVQRRQQASSNVCAHSKSHQIRMNVGEKFTFLMQQPRKYDEELKRKERKKSNEIQQQLSDPLNRVREPTEYTYKFSVVHHVTEVKSN